jgi:hypothetical protein
MLTGTVSEERGFKKKHSHLHQMTDEIAANDMTKRSPVDSPHHLRLQTAHSHQVRRPAL